MGCATLSLRSTWPASRRPGALWRLDGEAPQANLIRLGSGDRIQPHRNDEVEVPMVVLAGRGELTLDGQVHPLTPMAPVQVTKGRSGRWWRLTDPLVYLSVHRRRSSVLVRSAPSTVGGDLRRPGLTLPRGQSAHQG